MTSPLAGKPLRYLIGKDSDPGADGCVTVIGYDAIALPSHGSATGYINPRDEKHTGKFGPYLPADDISALYDEPAPIFDTAGFWNNFRPQISKWASLGAHYVETDNLDTYSVGAALKMFGECSVRGLSVLVKNAAIVDGDQKQLLIHPAAVMVIVEKDCGLPASYDSMRRAAGKPDLPIRFVSFDADGRAWAEQCAQQIKASGYVDMGVTHSSQGEYGSSEDILLPTIRNPQIADSQPNPSPMSTSKTMLDVMKTLVGTQWSSGAPGTKVRGWLEFIAAQYPEMRGYVNELEVSYEAWCAIGVAYCAAVCGLRPPFGPVDVEKWAYVDAWLPFGVPVTSPQLGDIVIVKGGGIHHITLFERDNGDGTWKCLGANQGHAVQESNFAARYCTLRRPPASGISPAPLPDDPVGLPEISIGSLGESVTKAQQLLIAAGYDVGPDGADGDFGNGTASAVSAFQAAHSLPDVDGIIGVDTWAALLKGLPTPQPSPAGTLSQDTINKIVAASRSSAIAGYSWQGRGHAPTGYTNGMAVTFAKVYLDLKAGRSNALAMTKPLGSSSVDALALYGMSATLINLFALLLGLGMRESSGNCYEGVDTSAGSNRSADEIEAGAFQQSWNSHTASAEIPKSFAAYSAAPSSGFLSIFREGLSGSPSASAGSGDALKFQQLCKACPAFSVEAAAIGLRVLRSHWGPINTEAAEFRREAVALFQQVQAIVDAAPVPVPVPVPQPIPVPAPAPHPQPAPVPAPITDVQSAIAAVQSDIDHVQASLAALKEQIAKEHTMASQPASGLPFSIPDIPDGMVRWAWPVLQRMSAEQIIALKNKLLSGQFTFWDLLHIVMGGSPSNLLAPPIIDISPSPIPPPAPAASPPVASGGLAEVLARPSVKIGAAGGVGTFMAALFGLLQDPTVINALYGIAATFIGGGVTGTFKSAADAAKAQLGK